jgi:hypothetical protein
LKNHPLTFAISKKILEVFLVWSRIVEGDGLKKLKGVSLAADEDSDCFVAGLVDEDGNVIKTVFIEFDNDVFFVLQRVYFSSSFMFSYRFLSLHFH